VSEYPWFKFFVRDWQGNPSLRAVSLAARGLWLEMLAIMHEATPFGHLVLNGKPVPTEMLALMVGSARNEVERLLAELESASVFRVNRRGIIHSARMIKERARSEDGRKSARKRWSQGTTAIREFDQPNGSPTAKKPEARSQSPDSRIEPFGSSQACRLPAAWALSPELLGWTEGNFPAATQSKIKLEVERFRNYWTARDGTGAVKRDWDAAWRLWALNQWGSNGNWQPQRPQTPTVRLHRNLHPALFAACERLRGKAAPGDEWRFPAALVKQAQEELRGHPAPVARTPRDGVAAAQDGGPARANLPREECKVFSGSKK